jgi:hypothetical protein
MRILPQIGGLMIKRYDVVLGKLENRRKSAGIVSVFQAEIVK